MLKPKINFSILKSEKNELFNLFAICINLNSKIDFMKSESNPLFLTKFLIK